MKEQPELVAGCRRHIVENAMTQPKPICKALRHGALMLGYPSGRYARYFDISKKEDKLMRKVMVTNLIRDHATYSMMNESMGSDSAMTNSSSRRRLQHA